MSLDNLEEQHLRSRIRSNNAGLFTQIAVGLLAVATASFLVNTMLNSTVSTGGNGVAATFASDNSSTSPALELVDGGNGSDTESDPYGNPGAFETPSDTPFYTPHQGEQTLRVLTVDDQCYTKYGVAWIYLAGITPNSQYTVQTDWTRSGKFSYGRGAFANQYGQATFGWSCYDSMPGVILPRGPYQVLITDRYTGFAQYITLIIGSQHANVPGYGTKYYIAPDNGPWQYVD